MKLYPHQQAVIDAIERGRKGITTDLAATNVSLGKTQAADIDSMKCRDLLLKLRDVSPSLKDWAEAFILDHGNSFEDLRSTILDAVVEINRIERMYK